MAVTSTVTIFWKDKKPGKEAAVIYGRARARIGSGRLRAKDFDLSTIRNLQLNWQIPGSAARQQLGTALVGSLASPGSPSNYFLLKGAAAGTPLVTLNFVVMGE